MSTLRAPKTLTVNSAWLLKSASIYEYTHISVSSLVVAFDDAKGKKG